MNKSEIQSCIDALQVYFDSKLAALKAEFAKCDCADKAQAAGIEQERCWFVVSAIGNCMSSTGRTKEECKSPSEFYHPAYMPECRQVTAEDARQFMNSFYYCESDEGRADRLHKLGFRMKVINP